MRPLTIGLFNSYDAHRFHEAMRRAVVRAAPLCAAYGFHLALIGFPWQAFEHKGQRLSKITPTEVAQALAATTSIGQERQPLVELAATGRLHLLDAPNPGFPAQWDRAVLATARPEPAKTVDVRQIVAARAAQRQLIVVGLGPRGVPGAVREACADHLELTGSGASLETATALGVLSGRLAEASWAQGPRLTVDGILLREESVLLVRRARPPFVGTWVLPGGFVEAGESAEEAVVREVREETGLATRVRGMVGAYSEPGRDPRGPQATLAYLLESSESQSAQAGDDAAEAAFHRLDDLPKLGFDHSRILADAVALSKKQAI